MVRRLADVVALVEHGASLYHKHAYEDARFDLLRDDDAALSVRMDLHAVVVPLDVVRRVRPTRRVAHQPYRAALVDRLRPGYVYRCGGTNTHRLQIMCCCVGGGVSGATGET